MNSRATRILDLARQEGRKEINIEDPKGLEEKEICLEKVNDWVNDSNFSQHSIEKPQLPNESELYNADRVRKNLFENVEFSIRKPIKENKLLSEPKPQTDSANYENLSAVNTYSDNTSIVSETTCSIGSEIVTLEKTHIPPVKLSDICNERVNILSHIIFPPPKNADYNTFIKPEELKKLDTTNNDGGIAAADSTVYDYPDEFNYTNQSNRSKFRKPTNVSPTILTPLKNVDYNTFVESKEPEKLETTNNDDSIAVADFAVFDYPDESNGTNQSNGPEFKRPSTSFNENVKGIDIDSTEHTGKSKYIDTILTPFKNVEPKDPNMSDMSSKYTIDSVGADADFNILDYANESSSSEESSGSEDHMSFMSDRNMENNNIFLETATETANDQVSTVISNIIDQKKKNKITRCKYCETDMSNKNFMRHILRNHNEEKEVEELLKYPKKSKERRQAFALLRNDTHFDLFLSGETRPNRQVTKADAQYYPCPYCKGIFLKNYLKRHSKSCFAKKQTDSRKLGRENHLSNSQTLMACAMDPTDVISKLNIKEQVFRIMKADEIALEAKKDLLISHFGESYLKKHKNERIAYACSNRIRELSRLLISFRKIKNDKTISLKEILLPKHFDMAVLAVREVSGYDHEKKKFRAPSLAMHLGTSLKLVCDELTQLILRENKGFKCKSPEESKSWLQNIKFFKKLVDSRWNTELASLANKDLMEKRWNKPLLLPLASDVKKFRDGVLQIASDCKTKLLNNNDDQEAYKLLCHCALALLILFNRRRIGDVQYLKIKDYNSDKRTNFTDFEDALSETEKKLTTKYKRILNSGKGNRAVVILLPEVLQEFTDFLLKCRGNHISPDNEYVFAIPGSTVKWGKGDVSIKKLCKKLKLEYPEAISSNKLRKQIATVMQLLSLSQDEAKQFAHFMGHTQKTHDEFYELPVDIYQTAKVSKLLLLMEKGTIPKEYKGKSLTEINLDPASEYPEEDYYNDDGVLRVQNNDIGDHRDESYHNDLKKSNKELIIKINAIQEKNDIPSPAEKYEDVIQDSAISNESAQLDSGTEVEKVSTSANESDSDPPKKKRKVKRSTTIKKGWTEDEMMELEEEFKKCIQNNRYPTGEQIKNFIKKTNCSRSVPVIRAKLQHIIRKRND